MRRSTALLAASGLFLVGVLVGVLAAHVFYLSRIAEPGGLARIGFGVMEVDLSHRLDLTAEQRRAFAAILDDSRFEVTELRRDGVARLFAIRDRSLERLAAILTPQQRAELDRMRREQSGRLEWLVGE